MKRRQAAQSADSLLVISIFRGIDKVGYQALRYTVIRCNYENKRNYYLTTFDFDSNFTVGAKQQ
jgi:hypothetical protein